MSERRFYRIRESCEHHTLWAKDENEAFRAMLDGLGCEPGDFDGVELTFEILTKEQAAAIMVRDVDTDERESALDIVTGEIEMHGDRPMLVGSTVF